MRRVRGQIPVLLRQKGLMEEQRTKSREDTERGKRDSDAGQRHGIELGEGRYEEMWWEGRWKERSEQMS